jgi:hypothetical protein
VPLKFGKNEHKLKQKNTDARWTKKKKEIHYEYKNHIKAETPPAPSLQEGVFRGAIK